MESKLEDQPGENGKGTNKKTKIIIVAVAVVVASAVAISCWYFVYEKPHSEAVATFNSAVSEVELKNTELNAAIESAQAVIDSGKPSFDSAALLDVETIVTTTRTLLREVPDIPSGTEDIKVAAEELSKPLDYSDQISSLKEKQTALENGIKQFEQVTAPTEKFIVERLQGLPTITGISAVTEDNDPNGKLNKSGGYTSTVYFADSQVDQEKAIGETIIDKGVSGGGGVEVYSTVEDAEKRNTYLAAFDGGILSSGSHHVVGTVLVRTSDTLTATQQSDLEKQIIDKLIELR